MRVPTTTRDLGLKITSALGEYCRYTGISAEIQRRGLHYQPRPDFSRLPGQRDDRAGVDSGNKENETSR